MPIGAGMGGLRTGRRVYAEMALAATITAVVSGTSNASLESNTRDFAAEDLLFGVFGGSRDAARTLNSITRGWSDPTETLAVAFSEETVVTTSYVAIGGGYTTAAAARTGATMTPGWSGTLFSPWSGLFVVAGPCIIRQTSPAATKGDSGTTLTTTFGAAVLASSLVVAVCGARVDTDFTLPGSFSELANGSGASNNRTKIAQRLGHSGTTVGWSGLSSGSPAVAMAFEINRPGTEI